MFGNGVDPIARTHSIASCISHQSRSGSCCILSQTIQVFRYDIDWKLKSEEPLAQISGTSALMRLGRGVIPYYGREALHNIEPRF